MIKKDLYESKFGTIDDCLSIIESGDTLIPATNMIEPLELLGNLHKIGGRVTDVEILKAKSGRAFPLYTMPELKGHIDVVCHFFSESTREGFKNGTVTFYPCMLHDFLQVRYRNRPANVFMSQCTPMDEDGYVMISGNNIFEAYAIEHANKIILEVNPNLPRIKGSCKIPIEKVDKLVMVDYMPVSIVDGEPDEIDQTIGDYVASLVNDGDCLQIGIGNLPNAIADRLFSKHDLGLHTEMFGNKVGQLIDAQVITGKHKNIDTGKHVGAFAWGTQQLYETLSNNPDVMLRSSEYVNDPFVISKIDNMVSVNSALEIDLGGQICSESIGAYQFTGPGGAFEFAYGVSQSKGGRFIITTRSTAQKGKVSKIKSILSPGAVVTIPRTLADIVVTEYGIAYLSGRSIKERTNNLIAVAHPDFRAELTQEAKKLGYI